MRAKSIRLPLKILSAVDALYGKLPALACKGLCSDSCGAVPMTAFEWTRVVAHFGREPAPRLRDADGTPWCPMLNEKRQCDVYAVRPLLCRLWGLIDVDGMRCPHGCVPEWWLTSEESRVLMTEISRISGPYTSAQAEILYPDVAKLCKTQSEFNNGRGLKAHPLISDTRSMNTSG